MGLDSVLGEGRHDRPRLVNARLDSVAEKPAYREAWQRRRCLIPASGFYEWSEPQGGRKRPYFIRPQTSRCSRSPDMWERWRTPAAKSSRRA
jgi:putative SOS response-associated peptidase YedK